MVVYRICIYTTPSLDDIVTLGCYSNIKKVYAAYLYWCEGFVLKPVSYSNMAHLFNVQGWFRAEWNSYVFSCTKEVVK